MVSTIQVESVRHQYGNLTALDGVTIHVQRGEHFGLLGRNGAGKSTLVRILTGTLHPTAGSVLVAGREPWKGWTRAGEVGVVFGENIVPEPTMPAIAYLRYFGALLGLERSQVDERAKDLLRLLELERPAQPIGTLSGGNRRKVEIARALLAKPSVLFLDEPTRELDLLAKRAVWQALRAEQANSGMTLFLSSHDAEEIETLCDRIAIVNAGRVKWEGPAAECARVGEPLSDALLRHLAAPERSSPQTSVGKWGKD